MIDPLGRWAAIGEPSRKPTEDPAECLEPMSRWWARRGTTWLPTGPARASLLGRYARRAARRVRTWRRGSTRSRRGGGLRRRARGARRPAVHTGQSSRGWGRPAAGAVPSRWGGDHSITGLRACVASTGGHGDVDPRKDTAKRCSGSRTRGTFSAAWWRTAMDSRHRRRSARLLAKSRSSPGRRRGITAARHPRPGSRSGGPRAGGGGDGSSPT